MLLTSSNKIESIGFNFDSLSSFWVLFSSILEYFGRLGYWIEFKSIEICLFKYFLEGLKMDVTLSLNFLSYFYFIRILHICNKVWFFFFIHNPTTMKFINKNMSIVANPMI